MVYLSKHIFIHDIQINTFAVFNVLNRNKSINYSDQQKLVNFLILLLSLLSLPPFTTFFLKYMIIKDLFLS
jgi:formate hydrogenlyase subunit 3/multisubunit Na+/H+ antiporter MnhD subunit